MRILSALAGAVLCAASITVAHAQPPIEAYGELPEIRSLDFSPDGSRFAFFLRKDGRELMVVFENGKGNIGAADVTDVKARSLEFVSNNHVVITASQATRAFGGYEDFQSSSFNVATGEITALAGKERSYRFFPSTAGGSLTPTDDPDVFYFSLRAGDKGDTPVSMLVKGNLASGRAPAGVKGSRYTTAWLVTEDGKVFGREDWSDQNKYYRIYARRNGQWDLVYEESDLFRRPFALVGYTADRSAFILSTEYEGAAHVTLHQLTMDGKISKPVFGTAEREYERVYRDSWGKVIGIRFAGVKPTYKFIDEELTAALTQLTSSFPNDSVELVDWTNDMSKLVVQVSGGATSPAYFLFDGNTGTIGKLTAEYLRISDQDIMPVDEIEFAARDGLVIPSILTRPKNAKPGDRLPLIIYPHGGPESYDALGFHYRAQYFASRGYLVLQPNFRGSEGFGADHRRAGHGEWGGKMQDDLTDGVKHLVESGWADPDRVCIMGASYGGYAALAGGAFTPELYKCVVAVAPVTDVPAFLADKSRFFGRYSDVLTYWQDLLGDRKDDRDAMAAISPVNAASSFKAPVLLMHGTDDTIVPFNQGANMENALRAAGKDVTFVKLKDADHWMSTSDTRLEALRETAKFIDTHIGPAN